MGLITITIAMSPGTTIITYALMNKFSKLIEYASLHSKNVEGIPELLYMGMTVV